MGARCRAAGRALMLALVALAWLGMRRDGATHGVSGAMSSNAPTGPAVGGDGELVSVGTRVQTQEMESGEWFGGTVLALHPGGPGYPS